MTVRSRAKKPLKITELRLGPVVVGGPYGESVPFNSDGICDTGKIAPGDYKLLLPDFDMINSRWTVKVLPGHVTRLEFVTQSQRDVKLDGGSSEPDSGSRRGNKSK